MIITRTDQRIDSQLFSVIMGSLLIALSAQIAIPLPFTPVPITMQNVMILLLAVSMGPRVASLSVGAYLLEGALGLPVFANGCAGMVTLFGPKGGYLFGFVAQAYLMGILTNQRPLTTWRLTSAYWLAWAFQIILGLIWLTPFVGTHHVLQMGLFPFIPGAVVKYLLFHTYLNLSWKNS